MAAPNMCCDVTCKGPLRFLCYMFVGQRESTTNWPEIHCIDEKDSQHAGKSLYNYLYFICVIYDVQILYILFYHDDKTSLPDVGVSVMVWLRVQFGKKYARMNFSNTIRSLWKTHECLSFSKLRRNHPLLDRLIYMKKLCSGKSMATLQAWNNLLIWMAQQLNTSF